ncbi:MAG: peptidylprolyl isomerase [Paracoccaceae bacterium]|nr:peptidylprolyl isomerase [Paracoccaceae bacterium]
MKNGTDMRLSYLSFSLCLGLGLGGPVLAQTAMPQAPLSMALPTPMTEPEQMPIRARIMVNNQAITDYEIAQRAAFLKTAGIPGDLEAEAIDALILDRLRTEAAAAIDITLTDTDLQDGMEEFAARNKQSAQDYLAQLESQGVQPETFREFVSAGILWRRVVSARFGGWSKVTDAEIDAAIAAYSQPTAARVLLSEIILPDAPQTLDQVNILVGEISALVRTEADFADVARRFSAASTRAQNGQMDWLPLANLPPQIVREILPLRPGQITPPIAVPNAIAFFLLRDIDTKGPAESRTETVDYAQFMIPGAGSDAAQTEAARVIAASDTCDDLYTQARGLPQERLQRVTQAMSEVPAPLALELARLDPGESSATLVQGDMAVVLMLCQRQRTSEIEPDRARIRSQLVNQKMAENADTYLAELRAQALIARP